MAKTSELVMKPTVSWILLADSGSARILENRGPGKGLVQLPGKTFKSAGPIRHSDKEGRSFSSFSPARHKMEPNAQEDPGLEEHVKSVLDALKLARSKGEFDRLIICAAPQTLGYLRDRLPGSLRKCTIAPGLWQYGKRRFSRS